MDLGWKQGYPNYHPVGNNLFFIHYSTDILYDPYVQLNYIYA